MPALQSLSGAFDVPAREDPADVCIVAATGALRPTRLRLSGLVDAAPVVCLAVLGLSDTVSQVGSCLLVALLAVVFAAPAPVAAGGSVVGAATGTSIAVVWSEGLVSGFSLPGAALGVDGELVVAVSEALTALRSAAAQQLQLREVEEVHAVWEAGRVGLDGVLADAERLEAGALELGDAATLLRSVSSIAELEALEETVVSVRHLALRELRGVQVGRLRAPELAATLLRRAGELRALVKAVESGLGVRVDVETERAASRDADVAAAAALDRVAVLVAARSGVDPEAFRSAWGGISVDRQLALLGALSQLGGPSAHAAAGPNRFDGAGLVSTAWSQVGRWMSADPYDLKRETIAVSGLGDLLAGDVVFWDKGWSSSLRRYDGNAAMFLGAGDLVVEARVDGSVRVSALSSEFLSGFGHVMLTGESWVRPVTPPFVSLTEVPRRPAGFQLGRGFTSGALAVASGSALFGPNADLTPVDPEVPYASLFNEVGVRRQVSPRLLAAVAFTESAFRTDVVSRAGAIGLMQFMPTTASSFGVDPWDPVASVDGAARFLVSLYGSTGSVQLSLAAYNAGLGSVRRYGGVPPFTETQNYVRKISALLEL